MPFHMLGRAVRAAAAAPAAPAVAGTAEGWRCWKPGAGAGAGAGIRCTDCDWRPIERLAPIGRAVASAIIETAVTANSIVARNFFMIMPLQ